MTKDQAPVITKDPCVAKDGSTAGRYGGSHAHPTTSAQRQDGNAHFPREPSRAVSARTDARSDLKVRDNRFSIRHDIVIFSAVIEYLPQSTKTDKNMTL